MKANVNGIAINYELSGPAGAPAVVLHHPLATNFSSWDELTAAPSRLATASCGSTHAAMARAMRPKAPTPSRRSPRTSSIS